MERELSAKSSVKEIERRFDSEVERFSNLETGQVATMEVYSTVDITILFLYTCPNESAYSGRI